LELLAAALAPRRNKDVRVKVLGRNEVVLRAVAGVGEELVRGTVDARCGEVLLGLFDHRDELVDVAGLLGDLSGKHDLALLVDHRLGVERVVKAMARLHHPGLGVGEVALGGGLQLGSLRCGSACGGDLLRGLPGFLGLGARRRLGLVSGLFLDRLLGGPELFEAALAPGELGSDLVAPVVGSIGLVLGLIDRFCLASMVSTSACSCSIFGTMWS